MTFAFCDLSLGQKEVGIYIHSKHPRITTGFQAYEDMHIWISMHTYTHSISFLLMPLL